MPPLFPQEPRPRCRPLASFLRMFYTSEASTIKTWRRRVGASWEIRSFDLGLSLLLRTSRTSPPPVVLGSNLCCLSFGQHGFWYGSRAYTTVCHGVLTLCCLSVFVYFNFLVQEDLELVANCSLMVPLPPFIDRCHCRWLLESTACVPLIRICAYKY